MPKLTPLIAPNLQKMALPVITLSIIVFFLIQGPVLFPNQWGQWQTITIIYALMVMISLVRAPASFEFPAWKVLLWFAAAFGIGTVLFKVLFSGFTYSPGFPSGDFIPTAVFQLVVISYSEESFFRGFLSGFGKGGVGLGVLPSALLFAVFHLAAYSVGGFNYMAFVVAFVMGIAFAYTYHSTKSFSAIGVVWGLHAAWNVVLLFG